MNFEDAVTISGTRRTQDGYLVAEARAVRTGIQMYAGVEVGRPDLPMVAVYRAADQVFDDASLQSFTHAPVTLDHPADAVTAENWKDLAVGEVSTAAKKDGEWVHLPLILKDAAAIQAVESGKRELSAGYTCELLWGDGVDAATGQTFQASQTNIKINHLAIVDKARAGSKARIGDAQPVSWGISPHTADERISPMADTLRKMLVDGLQVETTDAGAAAIEKLMKDKEILSSEKANQAVIHDTAIRAKDAELAKKDAEIDALKAKVLDDAAIDKRVQDRADLIAVAGKIAADVKTSGLSDAAIRKAVVTAKIGDAAIAGKPDAYIDARFDILAEDAKVVKDTFAHVAGAGFKQTGNPMADAQAALEKSVHDMNAWRKEA